MRKVLFLDRDGVINKDVSYLYKISDLQWVDGAKEALAYAYSKGYDLIVVRAIIEVQNRCTTAV